MQLICLLIVPASSIWVFCRMGCQLYIYIFGKRTIFLFLCKVCMSKVLFNVKGWNLWFFSVVSRSKYMIIVLHVSREQIGDASCIPFALFLRRFSNPLQSYSAFFVCRQDPKRNCSEIACCCYDCIILPLLVVSSPWLWQECDESPLNFGKVGIVCTFLKDGNITLTIIAMQDLNCIILLDRMR